LPADQAGEEGGGSDEVFGAGGGALHGPARAGATAKLTRRAAVARTRIVSFLFDAGIWRMHIWHVRIKGRV
jgi:hypothetical protein